MRILDIIKPDLKEERDVIARNLRQWRKQNPEKAKILLRNFRLGQAATERALQANLYSGTPLPKSGSLPDLFG